MADDKLNPKVLGQLLIMQSILNHLPDKKSIFSFVCKGLLDIPGVVEASYSEISDVKRNKLQLQVCYPVTLGEYSFGALLLSISDSSLFNPYESYLKNFIFMIGVILEERRQRQLNEEHKLLLEQRILERTHELKEKSDEIEAQNEEYQQINDELHVINLELICAKEKADNSENIFRKVFLTNPESITITRLDTGTYQSVNYGFTKTFEYSQEEVVGKTSLELQIWYNPQERTGFVKQLQENGVVENLEAKFRTKSGKILDCIVSAVILELENAPHIISITRDITFRKKMEFEFFLAKEKAEENELKFRAIFENSHDAIGISKNGVNVFFNQAYLRMFGFDNQNEIVGKNVLDQIAPSEHARILNYIKKRFEGAQVPGFYETIGITKQGREFPFEVTIGSFFLNNEQYTIAIIRDITQRKQAELELKEKTEQIEAQNEEYQQLNEELAQINEELLRAKELAEESERKIKEQSREIENFFSHTIDLLCIADTHGHFLRLNKEWENTLGYALEELEGKKFLDLVHPDDIDCTLQAITQLDNQEIITSFTNRYRCKDGEYKWIEWKAYPYGDRIFAAARDVTMRLRIEDELTKAKEKAEESDRLKTAFLQNMSHEIRTPMNAIMGFSGLLAENFDDKPKLLKFADIIARRCGDLLDIINDILDISKIEAGQLPVNMEECNLNELFEEISMFFAEYKKRIDKGHIAFSFRAVCSQPQSLIITDKVKLKQIFINLISNAFKFTETGKIEGGCKLDENQRLIFYVSDTGIGIPADKQKLVFERFAQLQQGSKLNIGGTGLGLPIVKGLIDLLGGEIFLESEPGKGSTFSFTISYKPTQPELNAPSVSAPFSHKFLSNKTILIVEDDVYNAEYLKEILSGNGLTILQTEFGRVAVDISISQPVDLVLMDVRLPDINGYEATRLIRQHKPTLKIIAQTAYASHDERLKALSSGCNDYISKPTRQDMLLLMLQKHLME